MSEREYIGAKRINEKKTSNKQQKYWYCRIYIVYGARLRARFLRPISCYYSAPFEMSPAAVRMCSLFFVFHIFCVGEPILYEHAIDSANTAALIYCLLYES